jgi:hypothetical protein
VNFSFSMCPTSSVNAASVAPGFLTRIRTLSPQTPTLVADTFKTLAPPVSWPGIDRDDAAAGGLDPTRRAMYASLPPFW